MVLTQKQTHPSVEQNREPRIKFPVYGQLVYEDKGTQWRNNNTSTSGLGKWEKYMQKNENVPTFASYTKMNSK